MFYFTRKAYSNGGNNDIAFCLVAYKLNEDSKVVTLRNALETSNIAELQNIGCSFKVVLLPGSKSLDMVFNEVPDDVQVDLVDDVREFVDSTNAGGNYNLSVDTLRQMIGVKPQIISGDFRRLFQTETP
ncbi:hypothetical protein, partial [Acetivibrio ethanolgignens]|uniref:hypothetical protein n=1 Tax=Acetivibrio ethanolgignens TaxID=290052 RepID=UPI0011C92E1A